jgi:Peptidase family M48
MRILKITLLCVMLMPVCSQAAQNPPASAMDQVVDRIFSREKAVVTSLHEYSPWVETYIQVMRPDKELGTVPADDRYFLGRARLKNGAELQQVSEKSGRMRRLMGGAGSYFTFSLQFLPEGFLAMIFPDPNSFDRQHYRFEYVRREFLGDVRCLVFDVIPLPKSGKGRFTGRIWVEDQDYTIARFNGTYVPRTSSSYYFHFDSWRVNAGPGLWLPAYIYSEESDFPYAFWKHLRFRSQTRLWGYNLSPTGREQELSKVLVEAATPVRDTTKTEKDLPPVEAQRSWDRQAEENVVERMERLGLLAPRGDMDKVLETVVNNLEVTNNLDIQPEVHCRIVLTSTLESFTIGHTIVLSRGLIDVLPDEASLALMIAHELAHIVLGHRLDPRYAFFDQTLFDDKKIFQNLVFARDPSEEQAAGQKAMEFMKNSPYKDSLGSAARFLQALNARAKQIPNLVSPHLGSGVLMIPELLSMNVAVAARSDTKGASQLAALPLGARLKMDPWNGSVELIKARPTAQVSEREKMPFEVTPFMIYLTRQSAATGVKTP